jgi:hypothetical protein
MPQGVPDITLIEKGIGRFIGLEVKREEGKLSLTKWRLG